MFSLSLQAFSFDLMQQTNKLLEEIQLEDDDSLSRPDFDSIEPFKIEYKKVDWGLNLAFSILKNLRYNFLFVRLSNWN